MGKRYAIDVPTPYTPQQVQQMLQQFAQVEGFKFVNYKGEDVLKKGSGWATSPQFIKVMAAPGTVHIEAWIKQAIFPGWYVGEMGLDGAYGFALKDLLRNRVTRLAMSLQQVAAVPPVAPMQTY